MKKTDARTDPPPLALACRNPRTRQMPDASSGATNPDPMVNRDIREAAPDAAKTTGVGSATESASTTIAVRFSAYIWHWSPQSRLWPSKG